MKHWMFLTLCCVFAANHTAAQVAGTGEPKVLSAQNPIQNPATNVIESNPSGGSQTISGTLNLPNSVTISSPCAIGGVIYVSGAGCYATLQAAFSACAPPGCTIDMRGASAATALNLGTFDPGTNFPIAILLGPYSYTLTQMTLRTGLSLIGMGHGSTFIIQEDPSIAPFILPGAHQTYPNNVANGVAIRGVNVRPATKSKTDAFSLVASVDSNNKGGGIWYSSFDDINVGIGFGRNAFRFDTVSGGSPPSTNQWIRMENVFAMRAANAPAALVIRGAWNGQFTIVNSQFDGPQALTDTKAVCNIQIDDADSKVWMPYSISMNNVTSQWAWGPGSAAICLSGAEAVTITAGHFEDDTGILKATVSGAPRGNWGTVIRDSYIATSSVESGLGYIANLDSQSSLVFENNIFHGTPDKTFIGSPTNVQVGLNWNFSNGTMQPWTSLMMGTPIAIAKLPSATSSPFRVIPVSDSITITTEGQSCVGGGDTKALAFSNGSVWKCF